MKLAIVTACPGGQVTSVLAARLLRGAAERLGFTYEGTFRQHMVVKQRNRDTAWFSLLDSEWPARQAAFERWLDPSNFDAEGRQRQTLEALRD